MVRLLVRLGKWLDSRFPAKVVITEASYNQLHTELSMLRSEAKDLSLSLNTVLDRLSVVEANAVHKEPVSIALKELEKLKNDYTSFKASMGFSNKVAPEIQAMLNGEVL